MKHKYIFLIAMFLLYGCEDRVRYFCQDPKNFVAKRCQRPDCLFTQDCPDYLVAPVLEKTIVQPPAQVSSEPIANPRGN
jgi:hypothetical protein